MTPQLEPGRVLPHGLQRDVGTSSALMGPLEHQRVLSNLPISCLVRQPDFDQCCPEQFGTRHISGPTEMPCVVPSTGIVYW